LLEETVTIANLEPEINFRQKNTTTFYSNEIKVNTSGIPVNLITEISKNV